jgi:hypothetical protein
MSTKLLFACTGMVLWFAAAVALRADVLEMQNGDRYSGQVLALSADTVVLHSEILGKINVPRSKVASLTFGTNAAAAKAAGIPTPLPSPNRPTATSSNALDSLHLDLSAALGQLGGDTNFIGQIRQQMLAGNPEAAGKFDELVSGLFSGQLNLNDLRRQAESSAAQLRALKRDLGPEADDTLDGYLKILDAFVKEAAAEPANQAPTP